MSILSQIFTWWNGQTIGTRLYTARRGQSVGTDAEGNHFYQTADGKRRWVIYAGEAEASRISPDWHGWLHHTFEEPPKEGHLPRKAWERDHIANMTGTVRAYRPPGSIALPTERARAEGDYEAWQPE